jgi:hypothetical protein
LIQIKALRPTLAKDGLSADNHQRAFQMIGYTEAPHAWGRAQRMAQRNGLNLAAAVVDGWLNRSELGEIVDACRSCKLDATCGAWLDHVNAKPIRLPTFCANAPALRALSPG